MHSVPAQCEELIAPFYFLSVHSVSFRHLGFRASPSPSPHNKDGGVHPRPGCGSCGVHGRAGRGTGWPSPLTRTEQEQGAQQDSGRLNGNVMS